MGQAQGDLPGLALGLLLLQRVDQLDGGEEPHAQAVLAHGLDADDGGQMGLAGTRSADQHHVLGGLDEVAFVQALDQSAVDRAAAELEPEQVAMDREPGRLHLVGLGAHLAFGRLGLQQLDHPVLRCHGVQPGLGQ